ncbi:MAG: 3-hydroxyisobutyrate dehydrogenase-like protein [Ramlibacter sp.]|jgi:3-hydroxyisobutyrate dehydrogenase|uniref:NAD(P)-dependent oxidoreductase n=1 Tax=Ramlibacter sp. TaxID=1917967 RepID=UPI00262996F6|nr:NAD(P)-dependent oxidoreductase [Ramlibacter sp.]MDB5750111.1 3-hydroxyisobutyrate dehydrogenase-like protein [Ramlibacter sp.]
MRIGIAGTGKMGATIARRLAGLEHQVTVWNRTRERAQPLFDAGIAWAATPRELAAGSDLVISLLTNEQALHDVYSGPDGLLAPGAQGKLFVEMSTVPPAVQQEMAGRAAAAGAAYLESPVGGSVGPASEGKLIAFVGGSGEDLARARPVLQQLCKRIEHVGPHGAGETMKLAVNLPLMVYWQTLGEALSLVEPLGLDPQRVIDILADSSGGPNMLKVRGGMIAQALAGQPPAAATVDVATMRKDVRAMLAQARSRGRDLPLTAVTLENFDRAAQAGLDGADCSQLPVWWLAEGGKG